MNRLKFLRNEKGESLEKIAKYLNVTIQTISNYENEKRDMTPETILKLAEYYNVSTDFLLGKTNVRNMKKFDVDSADIAFFNGINGLNEVNKEILKNIYEGLKAKEEQEKKNKK